MSSIVIQPIRRRSGFNRACHCGARPTFEIPGTPYCYCDVHARAVNNSYQRWLQQGGGHATGSHEPFKAISDKGRRDAHDGCRCRARGALYRS